MDIQLPASLINNLTKGDIVPFIGAGVSMSIVNKNGKKVFPSWAELLRRAAEKLKTENLDKQSQIVNLQVDIGMLQEAAKIAQEHLQDRRWHDFIQSQFSVDFRELDENCKVLPRAIWKLSNRVVTLNYDKVLEWAHAESANVCAFDNANPSKLAEFTRDSHQEMLWHLHGKIDEPKHMVLTPHSYHKLYQEDAEEHYKGALAKFKELVTNKILLFIGCSLDDAELLAEMTKQHQLFDNNTGPHYALVHKNDKQAIEQKLKGSNVQLLTFSDFGQPLIDAVQQLIDCKNTTTDPQSAKQVESPAQQPTEQATKYDKITVLIASPLDKPLDTTAVISKIKNYKYPIYLQAFTEGNLREADDYSILFLIAKKTSHGLLIEDNNAVHDYLVLKELEENLPINSKLTVLITDDLFSESELSQIDFPLIILPLLGEHGAKLKLLDKLTHQLFKKPDINHFIDKSDIQSVQITDKLLQGLKPENRQHWVSCNPQLPRDINHSSLQGFTGRLSDLASISEKLAKAASRKKLLTIKGSGGLGKTTVAKKVAFELANRGHFSSGVYFIDCENITSANQLEMHIGGAFNLQMADDLFGYLEKHHDQKNRLLIFDNLESLLYLKNADRSQNKQAVEQIKTLLSQTLLYASVLVTTRESINSEWEDLYPFREMESEEALALFNQLTKNSYFKDNDQEFARRKILEPLLNNNPLAIKLICDGMPKGKSLTELKQELEDDFFGKVKEADLTLMFDDEIDANINRQESLYVSILYSYKTLSKTQKNAFELFSLFPDGIDLDTFKRIVEESKKIDRNKDASKFKHPINDKDIKILTDKSLVESYHQFYKLQSVIQRFARVQFEQHTQEEELCSIYRQVLHYNQQIVFYITELHELNKKAFFVFLSIFNNLLAAISYGFKNGVVKDASEIESFFEMIDGICEFSNGLNLSSDFLEACNKINVENLSNKFFKENAKLAWQVFIISAMYYKGEFDAAFNQLKNLIPQEKLMITSGKKEDGKLLEWMTRGNARHIYSMEGGEINEIEHNLNFQIYSYLSVSQDMVHLAMNVEPLLSLTVPGAHYFEAQSYLKNGVELDKLEQIISGLHENQHLDRVNLTYIKSREIYVNYETIDKLVSVNPYTRGIKNIMYAFACEHKLTAEHEHEGLTERIINYYQAALPELKHIKFYYAQAYYFYARFLKQVDHQDYETVYQKGLSLTEQYHYRYWMHRFLLLKTPSLGQYKPENYPLPGNPDVTPLIEKQLKWIKQNYGTSLNPFNQGKAELRALSD
jgi:hypothetical protein